MRYEERNDISWSTLQQYAAIIYFVTMMSFSTSLNGDFIIVKFPAEGNYFQFTKKFSKIDGTK